MRASISCRTRRTRERVPAGRTGPRAKESAAAERRGEKTVRNDDYDRYCRVMITRVRVRRIEKYEDLPASTGVPPDGLSMVFDIVV